MNNGDAGLPDGFGDASLLDAASCRPGDLSTFAPSYHPAVHPQSVCRAEVVQPDAIVASDPIQLFYDDCFGPHRSSFACTSFAAESPAFGACARCIETSTAAATYGPLVVDPVTGFVRPNVGGCIEITDPLALPCAKEVQVQDACYAAACSANCPVTDDASLAAYDACAAQAASGACAAFTMLAQSCVDAQASSAVAPCLSMTFRDFYDTVVPLFCAATATTNPPEDAAAASDATTDAALDAAQGPDASRGGDAAVDAGADVEVTPEGSDATGGG